jgi:hypothetical protein
MATCHFRAAIPATERRGSKIEDQLGGLLRNLLIGTNIEQLRNFGKKFIERLGVTPDSRIRSWKIVFCDFFGFVSN